MSQSGGSMRCAWWAALAAALWAAAGGRGAPGPRPRPVCPPGHDQDCTANKQNGQTYIFHVKGDIVAYDLTKDGIFTLVCKSSIALDEPALPRLQPALRVREVRLFNCWPRAGSDAAALRAINVLDESGSGDATGSPTYFVDLQLNEVNNLNASLVAAMQNLRRLTISYAILFNADLAMLPAGLERLSLHRTGIGRVPADVLIRLPSLSELEVSEKDPVVVEVEAARNLRSLVVISFATRVSLQLPDTLELLELAGWAPRRPKPWSSCVGLKSLHVSNPAAETLPDGWLAGCVRLRTLWLEYTEGRTSLEAGALRGATALEEVRLQRCALKALPTGLLDDARALRVLDLTHNHLHTLSGELLRRAESLRQLDLSDNDLTGSMLGALENLTSLEELRLGGNPKLDACSLVRNEEHSAMQGSSPLRHLRNLKVLSLGDTATRRLCPDVRQLPRLEMLDLFNFNLVEFNYTDLQFKTNITVKLKSVRLSREVYESVAAAPPGTTLTLELAQTLRCDCELYWAVAAMRLPDTRLRGKEAYCDDTQRWLKHVPLDELVCAAPDHCPRGCACGWREDVARAGRVLRLGCSGAGLRRVPRVDTRAALRYSAAGPLQLDLHLAGNRIRRLAPEDLPAELSSLDLRNNMLGVIDAATAAALVSRADRRVWLADNPLECDCRAAAALAAMREHADVIRDWANATCSDGTLLRLAAPRPCDDGTGEPTNVTESVRTEVSGGMSVGAIVAASLGSAVASALVLVLVWAALRRRLRARAPSILQLERLDDGEWLYDAFVSFAHADLTVVCELVERLEGGAAPLRLCVHYRDWVPGGWIPAQIALSVRISRRTVAVVSEAFLRSKWARAEFREAYAAAMEDGEPRLVLVLLEDPARLPLDAELRAYVGGNTYLRWGDPWFWRKLRSALPPPSARPAAEAAAESPSPPTDPEPVPSKETSSPPARAEPNPLLHGSH